MRTVPLRYGTRRHPIEAASNSPAHPQLFIVAASLALWTLIIAFCSFLLG